MLFWRNVVGLSWLFICQAVSQACESQKDQAQYVNNEIQYLASLGQRLTGFWQQNKLIDHIYSELHCLGFQVHTSTWSFPYFDGPHSPLTLSVDGEEVQVSSYGARLGRTNADGVTAELVNLWTTSLEETPDWKLASGKIAVTNITNFPDDRQDYITTWPDSPPWKSDYGSPELTASKVLANLSDAANAGVKGIIYVWQKTTAGLMEGEFIPFRELYQGVPVLFTHDNDAQNALLDGAKRQAEAKMTIDASVIPSWPTRTLWIVVEGTDLKNESLIINTHTDGTNVVEENGYIALLLKAAELAAHPPRRTTVLVWVSGHMQQQSFSAAPGTATSRWLAENPQLWAGAGNSWEMDNGGQLKCVVATCVEHLGAVRWTEDLENDVYAATDEVEPELLYASTPQLNGLLRSHWRGADLNMTRISNANTSPAREIGEGMSLLLAKIPNFALATLPSYLLKVWPKDFDETQLINQKAMGRQLDSFLRMWNVLDSLPPDSIHAA